MNCDDGNSCTSDYCGANGCINDPVNCDDGNSCTSDYCGANGCVHDPVNCDDANASTTDLCGPSGCVNTPLLRENSNANSVEFLSQVIPEMQSETPEENATTNESQGIMEEATLQPICDDGDPCTENILNGAVCTYLLKDCNDENESTLDFCMDGVCTNEPIDSGRILSENNSTVASSSEALMAGHHPSCDDGIPCTVDTFNGKECEHKPIICDDGDASTFDYCFEGKCYNTTTSCDDGIACTADTYNGTACVHPPIICDDGNACTTDACKDGKCVYTTINCDDGKPCTTDTCDRKHGCQNKWKCDDGNPCTVDSCDSAGGCKHSPVVCGHGKTCINGVCQYPYYYYYPYYTYAAPYYPYVAPASTVPTAKSYTIPAGTAITLPWGQSVMALDNLKVENSIAYSSASPLRFVRVLGLENQAISVYQSQLPISERAEMIGLSWKDTSLILTLIQPNGSALPAQGDNQNVVHLAGTNYDYYFLRNAAKGNWGIEIRPVNPSSNGVGFSLITGLVKGAVPINQP
ncbi:MAG: hypothetical protein LUO89_01040 [Methanothrix sp.]|nr:hypothetical protein [Methanothrix sp.]